jgi:uncharacterized iron-regulated membrane protein
MRGVLPVKLRKLIFWLHLSAGVVAGSVVFVMSVTGVLLAFERQIMTFAERHTHTIQRPASDAPRLGLDVLVAKAHAAVSDRTVSGITLRASPTQAVVINFGRDRAVFVDPYTGAVLGEGAKALRAFFHMVTDWHRWLGREGESRDTGRAITGACNAAFVVLVVTGFYLWWPRRWTRRVLRLALAPSFTLRGRSRNWNWHNTAGFWSAPVLLCITLTGLVMSYQWANDLLYTLTGNEPPPPQRVSFSRPVDGRAQRRPGNEGRSVGEQQGRPGEAGEPGATLQRASFEMLFAAAVQQAPHWRLISLRLPQRGTAHMTVIIEEAPSLHPAPRSTLTLDARTVAVVKWEPYAGYNLGRKIRSWVRPVHTGEAGGLIGQIVAALASVGATVLVWTGLSLAWRRFFGRQCQRQSSPSAIRTDTASPGPALPHSAGVIHPKIE